MQVPLGYDVGSDSLRGSYLLRARDTGKPAATPVMRLPVGGTGINVFRPVYRDGAPTGTVAQRRAALIGFAAGAFHVPDLAQAANDALPDEVDVAFVERGKPVVGPDLPDDEAATAPIRDRRPHLAARRPRPEPAGSRPAGDDRRGRPLAGGAAGGAGPDLEPQRTHAGAAPARPARTR